jgi:hypothetical protein
MDLRGGRDVTRGSILEPAFVQCMSLQLARPGIQTGANEWALSTHPQRSSSRAGGMRRFRREARPSLRCLHAFLIAERLRDLSGAPLPQPISLVRRSSLCRQVRRVGVRLRRITPQYFPRREFGLSPALGRAVLVDERAEPGHRSQPARVKFGNPPERPSRRPWRAPRWPTHGAGAPVRATQLAAAPSPSCRAASPRPAPDHRA